MDGPDATADGTADFGLTNSIVAACWHGYFTGNVGTLKVLVDYPYPTASSTRKAVSIGVVQYHFRAHLLWQYLQLLLEPAKILR